MKLWKDMTPEEKGALLLAYHEGKTIEWKWKGRVEWEEDVKGGRAGLSWEGECYYRVKPEPKKPREFWVCGSGCYTTEGPAIHHSKALGGLEVIHVREVLE